MRATELADLVEQTVRAAVAPLVARLTVVEGKATAADMRMAILETMRLTPGPPGPAGADGKDGRDGVDGRNGVDGGVGLRFVGVYQKGATYNRGDVVTWNGSAWHANEDTIGLGVPGDGSGAWTLIVKHGRDGRDAKGA